jgi:NADH-quinone oxidoreductase subunit N
MTPGNLAAIRQENIKRMLAYSSIGHAGYFLIGVTAAGFGVPGASSTVIFHLVAYVATTLGAFTVASWVGRKGDEARRGRRWNSRADDDDIAADPL